jgi:hypothetical protein
MYGGICCKRGCFFVGRVKPLCNQCRRAYYTLRSSAVSNLCLANEATEAAPALVLRTTAGIKALTGARVASEAAIGRIYTDLTRAGLSLSPPRMILGWGKPSIIGDAQKAAWLKRQCQRAVCNRPVSLVKSSSDIGPTKCGYLQNMNKTKSGIQVQWPIISASDKLGCIARAEPWMGPMP